MNKREWAAMMEIAQSETDLSHVNTEILFLCGLKDFKPIATTLRIVAAFTRYQALQLNGEWDSKELDNLHSIFRHKVTILDFPN